MTKAEEVFRQVEKLTASGKTKAEAFKELAAQSGSPLNTLRGAYYQHNRGSGTGSGRPRRRETTPEDALAAARAALERAIENIDHEVEFARERASEAKQEYDAMKASATVRKDAIAARMEALR